MKTKGKRLDGIFSPMLICNRQGNSMIRKEVRMQQVREVMTVNQEMEYESSCIWLTLEQMRIPLRSEFANENHGEARSSQQCNDQHTDQTASFLSPIITDCK